MLEDFFGSSVQGNGAVIHDDEAVHILGHQLHLMLYQNDRDSLFLIKPADDVKDLLGAQNTSKTSAPAGNSNAFT